MRKSFAIAGFLLFFVAINSCAQSNNQTIREKAVKNLVSIYYQSLGSQAELYQGPLYETHIPRFNEGHPFFSSDSFATGTIGYNGLVYEEVPLLYDIIRDELIARSPGSFPIVLIKHKVDSFSFYGKTFINLKDDTSKSASENFYERLYDGKVTLLAKRKKLVHQNFLNTTIERIVYKQDHYFIYKNGIFEAIKNKKALLNILKDKRNVLQRFIKQNNLKPKENFEVYAAKVVAYYDQVN